MRGPRVIIAGGRIPTTLQLHSLLDSLGYDAVVTENGQDALAVLEAKPAQLIIFDGHLPARDVIGTQEQIKRHPQWSNIPLVMMAAQHSKTAQDDYFPFGYEALLSTPFELLQLHTLMQEFLATAKSSQRKHPRIRFKIPVVINHKGSVEIYQPLNLSEGGVYLKCKHPLPVGTAVDIALTLPGQKPLELAGLVIHQKGSRVEVLKAEPGMAIKFQKSDKISSAKISRFITNHLLTGLPQKGDAIINRAI